jgi:tetratricopeptide (TPR) repeat protein
VETTDPALGARTADLANAAPAEPVAAGEADDEPHGLGWLLSLSGLGAVTPERDPAPISAKEPADPDASAEGTASGAPSKGEAWFAATAETPPVAPEPVPVEVAEPAEAVAHSTVEPADQTPTGGPVQPAPAAADLPSAITSAAPTTTDSATTGPAPEKPAEFTPAQPALTEPAAAEHALGTPAPAPTEPTAAPPAPTEPAPAEPAPAQPGLATPTPAQPGLATPTPAEPTLAEPTPATPAPAPARTEPTVAEPAPTGPASKVAPEAGGGQPDTEPVAPPRAAVPHAVDAVEPLTHLSHPPDPVDEPADTADRPTAAQGADESDAPRSHPSGPLAPQGDPDETSTAGMAADDLVVSDPAVPGATVHETTGESTDAGSIAADLAAATASTQQTDTGQADTEHASRERTDTGRADTARTDMTQDGATQAATRQTSTQSTETQQAGTQQAEMKQAERERAGNEQLAAALADTAQDETQPVGAEPLGTELVGTEQAETEHADTEPAGTDRAATQQADTEQAEIDQAETQQAGTEQTGAEHAGAEHAETQPAGTEQACTADAVIEASALNAAAGSVTERNVSPAPADQPSAATATTMTRPATAGPEVAGARTLEPVRAGGAWAEVLPEAGAGQVHQDTAETAETDTSAANGTSTHSAIPGMADTHRLEEALKADTAEARDPGSGVTDAAEAEAGEPTAVVPTSLASPTTGPAPAQDAAGQATPAVAGNTATLIAPAAAETTAAPIVAAPAADASAPEIPGSTGTAEPVTSTGEFRTGPDAVRTPSMQLPVLSVAPPPQPEVEPLRRRADPEQILAGYPWRFDPLTLREIVDDPEPLLDVRDRLTDKLEYAERDAVRARLLGLRAVVSRVLGDLGRALADAREALRHAEATGELRRTAIVQARLAHVQQCRGDFAEADRLFEEANSVELPERLRAEIHVQAGKCCYEQGRYLEACNHFEAALELRRVNDPDLVTRTEAALDAVMARVQEAGWGPYPRSREEILQQSRPPHPAADYESGLWGYADDDGEVVIAERYAEAQPFHEGAAWVRRPGTAVWELIDESGTLLIDSAAGYLQAGPFGDGLAWVSRDPVGGFFAVDWHNRVIVPGGFDEVRPFRRGLAVVHRGGWGAIDRHGRVVVALKYHRFATELIAGGPVEGFTGDGLAVVDAGDRFGVVDRTGQLVVAPAHPRLVIHPVAFIVGDQQGRWGALDRRGEPLVDVVHPRATDVVDEIERLLADTRPVL